MATKDESESKFSKREKEKLIQLLRSPEVKEVIVELILKVSDIRDKKLMERRTDPRPIV